MRTPDFLAELSALDANVAALLTFPVERLARQPAPNTWSALQSVEHIVLVNRAYLPKLRAAITEAHATRAVATGPFSYTFFGRLLVWSFEPPPRLRLPVPSRSVIPSSTTDVPAVRHAYEEHHAEFRECIRDAMTVDMRRTKVRSPFARRVSVQLGTAIGALLAHERRHLYQARKAAV